MTTPSAVPPQPAKKKGMSTGLLVALILGGLCILTVPIIAIIAAIAIPNLLRSRMAANESAAIGVCKVFAMAEDTYRRMDHNNDGVLEYATTLQELQKPGLIDMPMANADASAPASTPKAGYYFKVLMAQGPGAPGGEKSYVDNGHMTRGYALLAYPASWDRSGRNCFLINNNGTVYQKDLGSATEQLVLNITEYDPNGWIESE